MKGFKVNEKGDVSITNGVIDMISGEELTAQTIRTVIGTNKGEWFLNADEGIDFRYLIGKGVTEDMIRTQIDSGVKQVDETLFIDKFETAYNEQNRAMAVKFTARNNEGLTVTGEKSYE